MKSNPHAKYSDRECDNRLAKACACSKETPAQCMCVYCIDLFIYIYNDTHFIAIDHRTVTHQQM